MAKKQSKEVALKEATLSSTAMAKFANYTDKEMAAFNDISLDVADNNELFQNDILIPKVWLIQAMSELRKQKKADEGDFVDSQTAEILASEGETLQFVVLKTFKRWHTFKLVANDKKEFVSSEIMVFGKNHDLPYEETVEGDKLVRRQVISAYVLLEKDAVLGVNKPYIIDFASSSKRAGRMLISDIKTLNTPTPDRPGLPCFVGYFKMTANEENFSEGSAYVKHVQFGGYLPKTSMPFLADCRRQLDVMESQIEIDDSDVIESTSATKKKTSTKVGKKADSTEARI